MQFHQIRYFLAVCETLNFTRAAEHCRVSQPALTRAIRGLEDEFGGILLHRDGRHTRLTELGRLVRPYLEDVLSKSHLAVDAARRFKARRPAVVRIGVMCTVAPSQSTRLVAGFAAMRSLARVEIVDASRDEIAEKLLAEDIDVALSGGAETIADERFHVAPLFRERMMVIVAPGDPLAGQAGVRPEDLHGRRYVMRSKCEMDPVADAILAERRVEVETRFVSDRDDWVQAIVAQGLGFGFIPERSVVEPHLVALPFVEPELWRLVGLVTVRGRPAGHAVGALLRAAAREDWGNWPAALPAAPLPPAADPAI